MQFILNPFRSLVRNNLPNFAAARFKSLLDTSWIHSHFMYKIYRVEMKLILFLNPK